jgi:radical SAM protein with 4Fe4S-binding SPASM domain
MSLGVPQCVRERELALSGAAVSDLTWVDAFIARIRPYVYVREADSLIIKRPNVAQRLNPTGVRILTSLLGGRRIADLLDEVGRDPGRVRDIAVFLWEVKRFMEGTVDELAHTSGVEVQPFRLGFSRLPILSEIALTYRCNLRCTFCYAGCNCTANPAGDDREMTTADVRDVLRRIASDAEVPSVSFTGGEATLRSDLPELVGYAHDLGMRVNLITNGTRITAVGAEELVAAGLDSVQVSLEGVTAEVHERITRVRHSFERTIAAVHHFKATGIHVHTNTTINRDNVAECRVMPGFVEEVLGLTKFSMNLVIPTGSAAVDGRLAVRYDEIGPVLVAIAAEARRRGVEFMWYSPTPMCLFNPVVHGLGNKGCAACDGLLSIAANGDVLPCASYDERVGNVLEQDLLEIWRSPRAEQFREKFLSHPECRMCDHFQVCNGACPLYWRQLGFDELCSVRGFQRVGQEHFEQ